MKSYLLVLCALAACVDKGAGPQRKKVDPNFVAANLVADVPADVRRVDVALGAGVVVYAGSRTDHETVAPGQTVKVTHYWQVLRPPGPGWRVFAFVRGEPNTADFMSLPATDMELGHPPDTWQSGEIVQDVQDIVLRPDWHSKSATLIVGLIHVGGHDVGDRMPARQPGEHADVALVVDNAILAREWQVDLSKAPPPAGTVYVPHASGPITIDGAPSEPAWATAVTSPDFVVAEGCPEPVGRAFAKLTWDEQNLYVYVSVADTDIVSQYKQHDEPMWKQDAVEVFIDADSNRRGYVELQVDPNNATFDSWFQGTKAQGGDEAWNSGMVTAVKLRGTTEPGDTDQGWDAEIAIPYAAVKGKDDAMNVRIPPQVGDRWRLNIVRVDVKTGSTAAFSGGTTSWNRITCADFHALDRMLNVVFADKSGSIVPAPEPAEPPTGTGTGTGSGSAASAGSGSAAGTGSGSAAPTSSGSATGTGSGTAAPTPSHLMRATGIPQQP